MQGSDKINLLGPRAATWWTGKAPTKNVRSLPQLRFQNCSRQQILDYFDNSWTLTEILFSALQGEEAFVRAPAHGLRHPLIFYYCHPAVLYVNKLRVAGLLTESVDADFEQLFETGVDEMSWDDMSKNQMQWPEVARVTEYRRRVYPLIRKLIETHPVFDFSQKSLDQESPAWALAMGFEHERIHLETSSVLMRELPVNMLRKPDFWPDLPKAGIADAAHLAAQSKMLAVRGGIVEIGKPSQEPSFGWDNEYGTREIDVPDFEVSPYLISNAEFRHFVASGGYRDSQHWSDEGWRWRQFRNSKWPSFWVPNGPAGLNEFKLRTMFELIDLPDAWPAVVNFHEARAYCAWKTAAEKSPRAYRLPSEAEQHRLRVHAGAEHGEGSWNVGLAQVSENSVTAQVKNGLGDVFGNVWQWCEDEFNPLSGFKPHPYYEDFSTPCFDGKHQLILGGSFISTGDEAGPWARFHFRPHFFQHAGFRLARAKQAGAPTTAVKLSDKKTSMSDYESQELLAQYLLLHFASTEEVLPYGFAPSEALHFPRRCAEVLTQTAKRLGIPMRKALDIGCAVGGSSFELARGFDEVLGLDLSALFITTANQMKKRGGIDYQRKDEGDLQTALRAQVDPALDRNRVSFRQADACSLPPELIEYDAVLMANLLCRLPSPRSCLARMSGSRGIVRPGGLLMTVTPASWLEEHTPKVAWLGGFSKDGQAHHTPEALREFLGADFECLQEDEMPLLIREHARKFQYIVSHLMIWRRK